MPSPDAPDELDTLCDNAGAAMLSNIEAEFEKHNRLALLDQDRAIILGVIRYGARVILHEAALKAARGIEIARAFNLHHRYREKFEDKKTGRRGVKGKYDGKPPHDGIPPSPL